MRSALARDPPPPTAPHHLRARARAVGGGEPLWHARRFNFTKNAVGTLPGRRGRGFNRLLNHRIGTGEERTRHGKSECICDFEIDDQFEFAGCLDRKLARLRALRVRIRPKSNGNQFECFDPGRRCSSTFPIPRGHHGTRNGRHPLIIALDGAGYVNPEKCPKWSIPQFLALQLILFCYCDLTNEPGVKLHARVRRAGGRCTRSEGVGFAHSSAHPLNGRKRRSGHAITCFAARAAARFWPLSPSDAAQHKAADD